MTSLKRQLVTSLLALSLLAPNVVSAKGRDEVINSVNNAVVQDKVSKSLKNEENKELKIIVLLNDNSENFDFQSLRTEAGKQKRLKETRKLIDNFKSELNKKNIKYSINYEYDFLLCGLAITTNSKNIKEIKKIPSVRLIQKSIEYKMNPKVQVSERNLINQMRSIDSNNMINLQKEVRNTHKGEGMLVSVLDSGVDVNHPILRVSNPEKGKYKNAKEIKDAMNREQIDHGEWKNNKVVYAYNYFLNSNDVLEPGIESHGMHVSGIAVGNPIDKKEFLNPETGTKSSELIVGVAPEAQLMFMNVFDNSTGSTGSEIYSKAIEDSVKLGADSINMSLGAPNGTLDSVDSVTIEAINKAKEAGSVVAIAAGNEGWFGYGNGHPLADNPDYGTLGTPSVAKDSLSVASINTTIERSNAIEINGEAKKIKSSSVYSGNGSSFVVDGKEGSFDLINAGIGKVEDFQGKNFDGKVALIERGDLTFAQKILNAQEAKAAGVVIFNSKAGGNEIAGMDLGSAIAQIKIPAVFIGHDDGVRISKLENKKFKYLQTLIAQPSPMGYLMSEFSSYGISTDGEFKPDITAPGGNIFSSVNEGGYMSMNGTSMATPHVAGAIPILRQELNKKHPEIKGKAEYNTIKAILMSTAIPVKEGPALDKDSVSLRKVDIDEHLLVSPRKQGSGLMNVEKALNSELYLTDENDKPNIWLGNTDGHLIIKAKIHNIGKEAKTLKYDTVLQTDEVENNKFALRARKLEVVHGKEVTVQPNSSETVEINIDATKYNKDLSEKMKNGYFLEGFVLFKDATDNVDLVSIPYCSFKGNWAMVPVWEKSVYDLKDGENSVYEDYTHLKENKSGNVTSLVSSINDEEIILGYDSNTQKFDKTKIAISPNGDGVKDYVKLRTVFLRNAKDVIIHVAKVDNPKLATDLVGIWGGDYLKNSDAQRPNAPRSNEIHHSRWDGNRITADTPKFDEGKYKYTVIAKSSVKDAPEQKMEFEVYLDKTKPVVKEGKLEGNKYTPDVEDTLSGVETVKVQYGEGADLQEIQADNDGKYTLPEGATLDKVLVTAIDYAGNTATNRDKSEEKIAKKYRTTVVFYNSEGDMMSFLPPSLKVTFVDKENPERRISTTNNGEDTFAAELENGDYIIEIETPEGKHVDDNITIFVADGSASKSVTLKDGEKPKKEAPKEKRKVNIEVKGTNKPVNDLKIQFINKANNEVTEAVSSDGLNFKAELLEGNYVMKATAPKGFKEITDEDLFVGSVDIDKPLWLSRLQEEKPVKPQPIKEPVKPQPIKEPVKEEPVKPEPQPVKDPVKEDKNKPSSPIIHLDPVVPAPKTENDNKEQRAGTVKLVKQSSSSSKKREETKTAEKANSEPIIIKGEEIKHKMSSDKILQKPEKIQKAKFTDVKNHWSQKAVDMVTTMGLYKGMDEKHFAPDTKINRGMFVTLLNRLAKSPKTQNDIKVNGMKNDAYYAEAVKWSLDNKLMNLKNNKFEADKELTRAEVAEILAKYVDALGLKFNPTNNKVLDINKLNGEQQAAINKIVSLGIMQGRGNNKFAPNEKLTRAEIAQILLNIVDKAL